jgi:RNA polymerase sigma-70 factor (ECF subfamily)
VLILRDVLSWRAAEVAALLDISVAATNSTLHRARQTLAQAYVPVDIAASDPKRSVPARLHSLLDRYVRAWETADIAGLVALLRDDAVVTMPPGLKIIGRDDIAAFLASSVFDGGRRIRLAPVSTNASLSYVLSSGRPMDADVSPYAILVVEVDGDQPAVTRMTVFADPRLVARFASGG